MWRGVSGLALVINSFAPCVPVEATFVVVNLMKGADFIDSLS